MKVKEIALDNCPIHNCQPLAYAKDIELPADYDISPFYRDGRMWQENKWYVMQRIFPDAMIFDIGYTIFCPECAKKNPFPGKHNKFGYGFTSQFNLNAAKRNWNSACMRYYKHAIKDDLKTI